MNAKISSTIFTGNVIQIALTKIKYVYKMAEIVEIVEEDVEGLAMEKQGGFKIYV